MTDTTPEFWHHGLIAEWWATFNTGGPEIDFFGRFIADAQPALDAGCGTGRLLIPWLQRGYDVDGADASADMVDRARGKTEDLGLDAKVWVAPLHELVSDRSYRTIVVCGVLGLGTTRAEDQEGLRRVFELLEPGGTLLLDNEVPYASEDRWQAWLPSEQYRFPEPWPEHGERTPAADGIEYELRGRTLSFDSLDQSQWREIRAQKWQDDVLVASEDHRMLIRSYFRDELILMLERAGFAEISVRGGYAEIPERDHDFLVFIAQK
jgi:SAM-dependent methyltransferase